MPAPDSMPDAIAHFWFCVIHAHSKLIECLSFSLKALPRTSARFLLSRLSKLVWILAHDKQHRPTILYYLHLLLRVCMKLTKNSAQ